MDVTGPAVDLGSLVERALLSVDDRVLAMHDQLRDMALAIVREEGSAVRRSRLWGTDAAEALRSKVGYMRRSQALTYLVRSSHWSNKMQACAVQGSLDSVQGISLTGLASPINADAIRHMPALRILILDGVALEAPLAGFELPRLAVVSWRNGRGRALPFEMQTVRGAAVLSLPGCSGLQQLPDDVQARTLIGSVNVVFSMPSAALILALF